MFFPAYSLDYCSYVPQDYFFQNMNTEFMKLLEQNRELQQKNTQLLKRIQTMESENSLQKKQIKDLQRLADKKEKRKYSQRRVWLEKKFSCPFDDCDNKYSSKVALNSHLKRKHGECCLLSQ